jgi:formate hydrogenlyase transcriptional activator
MNKEIGHISQAAMEFLRQQDWPGNIRELQNFVERAVIMSSGPSLEIPIGKLERVINADRVVGERPTLLGILAEAQRNHILEALRQSGGIIAGRNGTDVRLGLARTTLLYRMQKLGIAQGRAVRVGDPARWANLGYPESETCPSRRLRSAGGEGPKLAGVRTTGREPSAGTGR